MESMSFNGMTFLFQYLTEMFPAMRELKREPPPDIENYVYLNAVFKWIVLITAVMRVCSGLHTSRSSQWLCFLSLSVGFACFTAGQAEAVANGATTP